MKNVTLANASCPEDRWRTVLGATHVLEKEKDCASSPALEVILPIPWNAARSARIGETRLSSLPSSHRTVALVDSRPSETVAGHEGVSKVCRRFAVR